MVAPSIFKLHFFLPAILRIVTDTEAFHISITSPLLLVWEPQTLKTVRISEFQLLIKKKYYFILNKLCFKQIKVGSSLQHTQRKSNVQLSFLKFCLGR